MLTTVCTLKCKACSGLMPEFRKRKIHEAMSFENVISYLSKFENASFYINQLILAGGEPFTNKDLLKIASFIDKYTQVGHIKILSNGTVPISKKMMEFLKVANSTMLWIDDYGKRLSEKHRAIIAENIRFLDENNVPYVYCDTSNGMWFDFGGFEYRGVKRGAINNQHCFSRKCALVLPNGDFTYCGRGGVSAMLGFTERFETDFVNLNDEDSVTRIDNIKNLKYLKACEYCNGGTSISFIEARKQADN